MSSFDVRSVIGVEEFDKVTVMLQQRRPHARWKGGGLDSSEAESRNGPKRGRAGGGNTLAELVRSL